MGKVVVAVAMVGFWSVSAMGGTVEFSPGAEKFFVDVNAFGPAAIVTMDLTLNATGDVTDISGADVVIGSDNVNFSFAYSSDFMNAMPNLTPIGNAGLYDVRDFLVGGNHPSIGAGASLSLGRVTIDTTSLPLGTYSIGVNTNDPRDGFSSIFGWLPGQPFVSEGLLGTGTFSVIADPVPEPATLALLGIGLLGFIRRHFAA